MQQLGLIENLLFLGIEMMVLDFVDLESRKAKIGMVLCAIGWILNIYFGIKALM